MLRDIDKPLSVEVTNNMRSRLLSNGVIYRQKDIYNKEKLNEIPIADKYLHDDGRTFRVSLANEIHYHYHMFHQQ